MTVIYVASPIDQAPSASQAWDTWGYYKQEAIKRLVELECEVYDPATAWTTARAAPAAIQAVNDTALATCDGVLGVLPDGVATIGVPVECADASRRVPVVIMGGSAAMSSPVLAARDIPVVEVFAHKDAAELLIHRVDTAEENGRAARQAGGPYVQSVLEEVVRAAAKFPDNTPTNTPAQWFGIVMEEYVEVAQAWNDWVRDGRNHSASAIRAELVQAGAMSARLYDSIRFID